MPWFLVQSGGKNPTTKSTIRLYNFQNQYWLHDKSIGGRFFSRAFHFLLNFIKSRSIKQFGYQQSCLVVIHWNRLVGAVAGPLRRCGFTWSGKMFQMNTLKKERTRRHHPLLWDSKYSTIEVSARGSGLSRSLRSSTQRRRRRWSEWSRCAGGPR